MQEIWDILKTLDYSPLWISLKTSLAAAMPLRAMPQTSTRFPSTFMFMA